MKRLLLIPFLSGCLFAFGQDQGTVTYEEITKMEIKLPPGMDASNFPNETRISKALYFTSRETLYKNLPQEEKTNEINSEGLQLVIKNTIPDNEYYKDLANNKRVEKRDFLERIFLMEGAIEDLKWKISPEQKKWNDYVLQKATTEVDTFRVVAWFTPQIQVSSGPGKYGQLPGLILEMDFNEGWRKILVQEVSLKPLEENIVAPKKGKKVTDEEFKQIQEEKLRELREQYGGKGGVFIHTETRDN